MAVTERSTEPNYVPRFGSLPLDSNHREIQAASTVLAEDATPTTPVTSPVTGATPVVLNIPENAVKVTFSHDATATVSTLSFNGQPGSFGLGANSVIKFGCAGINFNTITVTAGASTNLYFAFELTD
jgi:hypothetical protein